MPSFMAFRSVGPGAHGPTGPGSRGRRGYACRFSRALSPVDVARDKRQESLRGAEQARERSLVVLCGGAGAQSPAVDSLQADAPEPFGSTAGSRRPQVQTMVRLGFRLLGVLLAQQARGWLQRAHQGIRLD